MLMVEILHQLVGGLSHYLQRFIHPRVVISPQVTNVFHPKGRVQIEGQKLQGCQDIATRGPCATAYSALVYHVMWGNLLKCSQIMCLTALFCAYAYV